MSGSTKEIPASIYIHPWTAYIKITAACCTDTPPSSFGHQITHSMFSNISEEADRDLWMHPAVGRYWHQSIKDYSPASLDRVVSKQTLIAYSVGATLSAWQIWWLKKKSLLCSRGCTLHLYRSKHVVQMCVRHASMLQHVLISIFMSAFVSVSRAELRWATACCSAVTTPALVCIIYPPADWSRERHNHSNQSHAHTHTNTMRRNIG